VKILDDPFAKLPPQGAIEVVSKFTIPRSINDNFRIFVIDLVKYA